MWSDTVLIVFISLCTAFLGEGSLRQRKQSPLTAANPNCIFIFNLFAGLTWVLVYRTEKFQKLKGEIEKQSKKRKYKSPEPNQHSERLQSIIPRFAFQWKNEKKHLATHWTNSTRRKSNAMKKNSKIIIAICQWSR